MLLGSKVWFAWKPSCSCHSSLLVGVICHALSSSHNPIIITQPCHHHTTLLLALYRAPATVAGSSVCWWGNSVYVVENCCSCCRIIRICSRESMDQDSCHCVWHIHGHHCHPMSSGDCHSCAAPQYQACIDGHLHTIPPDSRRHCCTDALL